MNCSFCKNSTTKISLKKFEWFFCSNCNSYYKGKKNIRTYFLEFFYIFLKFQTGKFYQYNHLLFKETSLKSNKKYNFLNRNIKPLNFFEALDLSGEPFNVCLTLKKNKTLKDVTFTTYNDKVINLLKKKYKHKFFYCDFEKNHKFSLNNSYNLIIAWMCLYYSKNLKEVLANINNKFSKKKSTMIISSPEPTLKTIKYFDSTHIYPPNIFFSKKVLVKLMTKNHFKLTKSEYSKKIYDQNFKSYSRNFNLIFKKNN
jgi:hypothetical protein